MGSPKRSLKSIYDQSCVRPPNIRSSKSSPSFKPSILGSPCLRKIYYSYNKVPEDTPFPLANSRIANLGTTIGKMLFETFDKSGIAIKFRKLDGSYYTENGEPDYEFRLSSPDLGIKLGKIDLVCILDSELWLGEFKSINSHSYSKLMGPKPDHLIQGVLYLYLFNRALKEGQFSHIKELAGFERALGIRFLYYNKDKSEMKEFIVTTADEVFKNTVLKIQQVREFSNQKQLPPPTPDYCNSCSWRLTCAANKKAE